MSRLHRLSSGFTLVETVIIVTVCGILTGLLFGPLSDLYSLNTQGLSSIVQATDVKASLRQMEKSIALGNALMPVSYQDAGGITWRYDTTSSTVPGLLGNPLIISSYATEVNAASNRVIAISNSSSCNNMPIQMTYSTVFFVKNNTLYRRTIKPSSATTCDGRPIEQVNSCESPAANPTNCTATDAIISTNVTGFTVQYFDSSKSATPVTPSSDLQFLTFKTVVVSLKTTVGAGSTKTDVTNAMRMSLINNG